MHSSSNCINGDHPEDGKWLIPEVQMELRNKPSCNDRTINSIIRQPIHNNFVMQAVRFPALSTAQRKSSVEMDKFSCISNAEETNPTTTSLVLEKYSGWGNQANHNNTDGVAEEIKTTKDEAVMHEPQLKFSWPYIRQYIRENNSPASALHNCQRVDKRNSQKYT